MIKMTANEYCALLRQDLCPFVERSFQELNPYTEFRPGWHIEVITKPT